MQISKFTHLISRLKFDPELEKAFQREYDDRFYLVYRAALIVGFMVMALFGFLDTYSTSDPAILRTILVIRYAVICLAFLVGVILSFLPAVRPAMQAVTGIVSGVAGLGMAIMVGLSNHETAAFNSYYVGMIMVTLALYTFTRVRFWYALSTSLIIMLSYEVSALYVQQLLAAPMGTSAFIIANFFFMTANLVGAFASYNLEAYTRQDFLQKRTIEAEKARSESMLQLEAAEALRKSEARFRSLVEISSDGVVIVSPEGKFLYASPAYERISGHTAAELYGEPITKVVAPEDIEYVARIFGALLQNPDHNIFSEYRHLRKDGAIRLMEANGRILPDGNAVAYIRDITDRKLAEDKLRESEEYYRSLFENSSDGTVIFDRDGIFRYTSPGLTRIVGWDTQELVGQTWHALAHPDDLFLTRGIFHQLFEKPGEIIVHESRFRHKDGSWRVMEVVGKLHPNGYVVTNSRDITDRKQAEEQLRQLNEELEQRVEERAAEVKRLAAIIEAMPDYVGIADLNGTSLYVNQAGRQLMGKPPVDEAPWNVANCYPQDELPHLQGMFDAMRRGESWSGEARMRHLNGRIIPADHIIFPLRNAEGAIESYAAVIRDITERKQAEEELHRAKESAEAANKAKSTFLANMSHEIRTPMNAVIGMTSLLLETALNTKQRDFVETIRSSGDVLLTIINDILDFSKIEAGKMELVNRPLDLRTCIEATLDLLAPRIAEKNLNVAYYMENDVPGAILADATRLRQILVNLLGNAIKFTEHGEIVIRVHARQIENATHELHFEVRDTGIGIPPEKQDRLFNSFSQVDSSSTRVYGGTGLGLAISKRLAEMMEGEMWVESSGTPGEGSTFHFTIRAEEAQLPAQRLARGYVAELTGKKILLVDDHQTNLQILQLQTEAWGMMPQIADSAEQALQLITQGHLFDIAILDARMPGLSGLQLAKRIREHEASLGFEMKRLPLILLASVLDSEADSSNLFDALLTKPIKPSNLFDVLMTVFHTSTAEASVEAGEPFNNTELLANQYPLRILLAEDVVVNQKFALLALERMGYRADVAANGSEAMEAIRRQPYDVVLMDINMPVMDGYEASRRIHELWKNGSRPFEITRPWIVAMTANALQGDRELALEAGADDYISKPVYLNELQMVLARAGHARKKPTGVLMPQKDEVKLNQIFLQGLLVLPDGKSLILAYLEESPMMIEQLRKAVQNGNARELKDAAHALKGSSLYVGAEQVADLAKALELAGRANELQGVENVLKQLEDMYARVAVALTGILNTGVTA